jgi:hypothetical protein
VGLLGDEVARHGRRRIKQEPTEEREPSAAERALEDK